MMGTRPVTQQDSEGDKPVRVHFIVHEHFEAPGAFETWAMTRGHEVTVDPGQQATLMTDWRH